MRQLRLNFGPKKRRYRCKPYEMDGVSKPLDEWCMEYRREYMPTYNRIKKLGWTLKRALETPPLWSTNGRSGEPVVGAKNALERELNATKLEGLTERFRRIIKKSSFKGAHFGQYLRRYHKKEFDAYWKYWWQPRKRADYYHDKHTKQQEQEQGRLGAASADPRDFKPESGSGAILGPVDPHNPDRPKRVVHGSVVSGVGVSGSFYG